MTFSPFIAQNSREMYVYTRGYTDGYDYVVDTIGEMEEWEEALATDADALRSDPAQASPAPGARFAAPGSSAGLTSSPSDDGARGGSGVKTVAHDDDLGHVVASYESPGPGWVAVGELSDEEFDALDGDGPRAAYARDTALERARTTIANSSDGDHYARTTITFKAPPLTEKWNTVVYDTRYVTDSNGETTDLDDCLPGCEACEEEEAEYRLTPKGEALADEIVAKYKAEGALMAALDDVPGRKKATLVGNVIGLATAATIVAKNKDRGDIIEALEYAGLEATQNLLDAYK